MRLRSACFGSGKVKNQNTTAITSIAIEYTCGTARQPNATRISGATRLVTAAPALPAPKMPIAVPCFSFGNQAEV